MVIYFTGVYLFSLMKCAFTEETVTFKNPLRTLVGWIAVSGDEVQAQDFEAIC